MEKYNVFNMFTGENTEVRTLEEAVALQENIKTEFLAQYSQGLVINKIIVNSDSSETWSLVPQEHKVVSSFV